MMQHMDMGDCDMEYCMTLTKDECASYCDSMKCTPEQKEACMSMLNAHKGMMSKENCDKGCKDEEECEKSCDDKCVASHKEGKGCCSIGESNHCDTKYKM
jgi:K(+)-stimulated pyrophosphate-energized sodium pump